MNEEPKAAKKRERSPNHPMIGLEPAIGYAKSMFDKYGKSPVPIGIAQKLWGYTEYGSAGNQCVAALTAYGLIDTTGSGNERKLTLSKGGEHIVRNGPERAAYVREAALSPAVHKEVFEHFTSLGLPIPPDDLLQRHLQWERQEGKRFTDDAVGPFISRFRETLEYANINTIGGDLPVDLESGDLPELDSAKNGVVPEASPKDLQVGSIVQWTSAGVDQFNPPRKILAFSEDREWAFVEGSQMGIPVSQLTVTELSTETAAKKTITPPANPHYRTPKKEDDAAAEVPGMVREETYLDEGPVRLSWPEDLSADSVDDFEYWVKGLIRKAKRRAGVASGSSE